MQKNTNINHISFEVNYNNYPCIYYKKDFNFYFKSKFVNKLASKLKKLIILYRKNLCYT